MKERPIIICTELIPKTLDGSKTQTRRILKPQPDLGLDPFDSYSHIKVGKYHPTMIDKDGEAYPGAEIFGAYTDDGEWGWKCPYGQVGDRLWVRETYYCECHASCKPIIYKTDGISVPRWTSPLFMPRTASRITLEITDIRVERLQEISSYDIEREGLPYKVNRDDAHEIHDSEIAIVWFQGVWDSLNAKRGYNWNSNPFVWLISFKVNKEK